MKNRIGPHKPGLARPTEVPEAGASQHVLPSGVADAALVTADTAARIGEMSVSWWHEEVRSGRAPRPVIRQPRFTRWRLVDVRHFWMRMAEAGSADPLVGTSMTDRAKRASAKARTPEAVEKANAKRAARKAARQRQEAQR